MLFRSYWFVIALIIFGWTLGIIGLGLVFRTGGKAMFVSFLVSVMLQPFSCVFYSREILPEIFKSISYFIPTSYVFENLRSFLFNGSFSVRELQLVFLLDFVYLILAIIFLKFMYNQGRIKGNLVDV